VCERERKREKRRERERERENEREKEREGEGERAREREREREQTVVSAIEPFSYLIANDLRFWNYEHPPAQGQSTRPSRQFATVEESLDDLQLSKRV